MTIPANIPVTMPLDSAWRQWKGATRNLKSAELAEQSARNVWLTTSLDWFELRRAAAHENNLDPNDPKILWQLGVPCIHCLKIVAPKPSGHTLTVGGANARWAYWAECNMAAIDPTEAPMPEQPPIPAPKR